MTTITIPTTIDKAADRLASIDGLVTATEWERAAIVAAFVRKGRPGIARNAKSSLHLTVREFADRRISGLTSHAAIRRYLNAWAAAIADGHAVEVEPGAKVEIPDVSWSDYFVGSDNVITDAIKDAANAEGAGATKVADIIANKRAMVAAIKADPEVARAAAAAVMETDDGRRVVAATIRQEQTTREDAGEPGAPRPERDPDAKVRTACSTIVDGMSGARTGAHDLDEMTWAYIHYAAKAMTAATRDRVDIADEVDAGLAKIEQFLAS